MRGSVGRKRLRLALAVAALAALAVPVALAAEDVPQPAPASAPSASVRSPAASGTPRPLPEGPAPSNTPSKGRSTREGKGRPTPLGTGRPQDPTAARTPADGAPGTAPQVGVSSYNWDEPCGLNYLLAQPPDHVPPPPAPQDARHWARVLGGVAGGHQLLQLTATSDREDAVVLTSLHVRVVARRAALPWQAYSMGDGCGGGITPQTFDIDLDDARPVTKAVAGQDGDVVVPAKDFPFKVSARDPQVLNLDVHTTGHDVSWYLEVGWSSGGRQGTVRVDDGGKPFRTSPVEGRQRYSYWAEKNRWTPN
ncbi:transcriptional regulator [Streptomyces sp. NPDC020742]|uniref:transcriptional regulator n=1 Tax=Streptomyces sp. NPDC020742 TaxID=3154897 RepID=UPI0033FA3A84